MADNDDLTLNIRPGDDGAADLLKRMIELMKKANAENKAAEKQARETAKALEAQARAQKKAVADDNRKAAREAAALERSRRLAEQAAIREQREAARVQQRNERARARAARERAREEREAAREAERQRTAAVRNELQLLRDRARLREAEARAARRQEQAAAQNARQAEQARRAALRGAAQELRDRANLQAAEARSRQQQARDAARQAREQAAAERASLRAVEQGLRDRARLRAAEERAARLSNAEARRKSREEAQAARAALAAQKLQEAAVRRQSQIEARAAREAQRAAAARQRAIRAANREQERASLLQREFGLAVRSVVRQFVILGSIVAGARAVSSFVEQGIRYNQTVETAQLGIASLITAQAQLSDAQGNVLTGAQALNGAYGIAVDQVNKLRVAGIQTAATTEQLVDAFQQAVGAGLRVGLTFDQIRVFTIRTVQAAFALGVPMNQLNQEVRSILDGTIDRNSRVAKAIGLTNVQVRQAREQNRLAELLNEKLAAFDVAGQRSLETFAILRSNIIEAFQVFAGDSVRPLFESLRRAGQSALSEVFDFDSAQISTNFRGLIRGFQAIFREIGSGLRDGIEGAIDGAAALGQFLTENAEKVDETAGYFGDAARAVGSLVGQIALLPATLGKIGTESGALNVVFEVIASFSRVIRDNLNAVVAILAGFAARGGIAAILSGGPVTVTLAGLATLLAIFDQLTGAETRAQVRAQRRLTQLGEEQAEIASLTTEYERLRATIADSNTSEADKQKARNRLREVTQELIRLEPRYAEILRDETKSAKELVKELERVRTERNIGIALAALDAEDQLKAAKDQLEAAKLRNQNIPDLPEFTGARARNDKEIERLTDQITVLDARYKALRDSVARAADAERQRQADNLQATTTRPPSETGNGGGETTAERQARAQAFRLADAKLRAEKARINKERQLNDNAFAENLLSIEQYFNRVLDLSNQEIDAEIENRQAKQAASRAEEAERFLEDIEALGERRVESEAEISQRILEERRKFAELQSDVVLESLRIDRQFVEATAIETARQYNEALARALAEGDEATASSIIRIIKDRIARESFSQIGAAVSQTTDQLQNDLQQIEILEASGARLSFRANQERGEAYLRAAENVRRLRDQLLLLQPELGSDPEFIARLAELNLQVQQLELEYKQVANAIFQVEQAGREAIENGLSGFLENMLSQTDSLADAFKKMASSIIQDINRVISRLLAQYAIEQALLALRGIFGAAGGSAGVFGVDGGSAGGVVTAASGGLIRGPGTSTSDSIPAWLSDNEYVVRARAVKHYGPGMLDAINNMRVPRSARRFRDGGLVASPPRPSNPAAGGRTTNSQLTGVIGLEPGLKAEFFTDRSTDRVFVEKLARNAGAINAILRRRG